MTIADLIQSTIDSSKERIKTPITGAFTCSFIIYNWQPILILFFSDSSIESRIAVTKTYFDLISFLWPIGMAVLFTTLIPVLMWGLDSINIFAKKKRLGKSFENRKNLIREKIKIAKDVNELKDAESGNKEKQDYINQIKSLESNVEQLQQSRLQIEAANKISIDQLNAKLKEANKINEDLLNNIPESKYAKVNPDVLNRYLKIKAKDINKAREIELQAMSDGNLALWQLDQLFSLSDLSKTEGDVIDTTSIDDQFLQDLRELNVLDEFPDGIYQLTDHGKDYIKYVKKKHTADYQNFKFKHNLT